MRNAWILVVLAACSNKGNPPVSSSGSAPAAGSGLLPPIETACATDDDCGYAYTYEIDGKCCDGTCSPKPANHAWLDKVAAICRRAGHEEERCPAKKCAAPPPIACVGGQCRTR